MTFIPLTEFILKPLLHLKTSEVVQARERDIDSLLRRMFRSCCFSHFVSAHTALGWLLFVPRMVWTIVEDTSRQVFSFVNGDQEAFRGQNGLLRHPWSVQWHFSKCIWMQSLSCWGLGAVVTGTLYGVDQDLGHYDQETSHFATCSKWLWRLVVLVMSGQVLFNLLFLPLPLRCLPTRWEAALNSSKDHSCENGSKRGFANHCGHRCSLGRSVKKARARKIQICSGF